MVAVVVVWGGEKKKKVDVRTAVKRETEPPLCHLLSFSLDVTVQSLWITALREAVCQKSPSVELCVCVCAFIQFAKCVKMLFVNIQIG